MLLLVIASAPKFFHDSAFSFLAFGFPSLLVLVVQNKTTLFFSHQFSGRLRLLKLNIIQLDATGYSYQFCSGFTAAHWFGELTLYFYASKLHIHIVVNDYSFGSHSEDYSLRSSF